MFEVFILPGTTFKSNTNLVSNAVFKKILETGTTLININIKELYFLKLFYSEVYYYYLNIKIPFLNIYNNSNEEEENFIIESKNEFDKIPLNSNDNITECFVI